MCERFTLDRILTIVLLAQYMSYIEREAHLRSGGKNLRVNVDIHNGETIRMHISCGLLPFLSPVFRHVLNMFLGLTYIHLSENP